MKYTIKNLTGHPVNLIDQTIPSHGKIRLNQMMDIIDLIDTDFGHITIGASEYMQAKIPPKKEGVIYIVSNVVCDKHRDRDDLYMPWGKEYIDNVPYVKGLQRNPYFISNNHND